MNVIKKVISYLKTAKVEYIIILSAIFIDLLSKEIIQASMEEYECITLIPKFLELFLVYNDKAAFSFDFGLSALVGKDGVVTAFIIITTIAIAVFICVLYKYRNKNVVGRIALALVIGGAIGNLVDRIFIGRVRDFIQIVYFGLDIPLLGGETFAVFNIADACLVIGIILFAVFIVFLDKEVVKKENKNETNITENTEDSIKKENETAEDNKTLINGESND